MLKKLSDKEYFSAKGVNASVLKALVNSPRHVKAYKENKEHKRCFDIGSIAHAEILENRSIAKVIKPLALRSSQDKADALQFFKDEMPEYKFKEAFPDGVINASLRDQAYSIGNFVTEDEYKDIQEMKKSVKADKYGLRLGLNPDRAELAGFVECPETGLMLKAKYDYFPEKGSCIFDLKTSVTSDPRKFKWKFKDLKYWVQDAHYSYVANLLGIEREHFIFVVVESKKPYITTPFILDEESKSKAHFDYMDLLFKYKELKESNDFSAGYTDELVELSI